MRYAINTLIIANIIHIPIKVETTLPHYIQVLLCDNVSILITKAEVLSVLLKLIMSEVARIGYYYA